MRPPNSLLDGFKYAFQGLKTLFRSERNARIHLLATLTVILTGLWLEVSLMEWCILIITITIVIMAEGFNTAIEKMVDLKSPEISPEAGLIKDLSAGAVLIAAIGSLLVGILIFGPGILDLFNL